MNNTEHQKVGNSAPRCYEKSALAIALGVGVPLPPKVSAGTGSHI
jgi:hypothetical protein